MADIMLDFYDIVKNDIKREKSFYSYSPTAMKAFPNVIKHCRGAELLAAYADDMDDLLE